jgi:3-dehydroquinate synthase
MRSLNVELAERTYPIYIGAGLLSHADLIAGRLPQKRAAIITNTTVGPLYLRRLTEALGAYGVSTTAIVIPDGESYKNCDSLNHIFDRLIEERCERNTAILALGGGVVGDIAGFAAAVYQRGVPYVQVPTTLLAQVDSAVGGKTAINHPVGKNMIGAFYQPLAVVADTHTLHSLPARELTAGIAEVIKYGAIRDCTFFEWIEENIDALVARDSDVLGYAIERSCRNKAEVVALDEHESGVRAHLNFGHTLGHAIEAGSGYGTWLHGEAVAAGMVFAARVSQRLGYLASHDLDRLISLLRRSGLPTDAPNLGFNRYAELMSRDKKVSGGKIKFVLLKSLGAAFVSEAPESVLAELLSTTAVHA